MNPNRIQQIEAYAKEVMDNILTGELRVAHNYAHVDRVRNWAINIAEAEVYPDLDMVQTTALLHDIGLAFVTERRFHGEVGAQKAAEFLQSHQLFPVDQIEAIFEAIRCHNKVTGGGLLGSILRDGDILDLLGAMGIIRGCMTDPNAPEYDPTQIKGETWGITAAGMTARFQAGLGMGPTIVDRLNFHMSCYKNLHTAAAKELGRPLLEFQRNFIQQLEKEVLSSQIKNLRTSA